MGETPLVSVIMNCRNGEAYLSEALESVCAQDMDDWEIVFFDNESTDRSAEIATAFGPKLLYHRSGRNMPLGMARNHAIGLARGRYLAILDVDDIWLPDKLRRQVEAIRAPSPTGRGYGLCYTDAMRMDSRGRGLIAYSKERRLVGGDIYLDLMWDCLISMSSCLIDAAVFRRAGEFDARYEYVEDWDLWLRIARNHDVALVPAMLTKIRIHPGNQSRDLRAHLREKAVLFTRVAARTAEEERVRRRTLDDLAVRDALIALLAARGQGLQALAQAGGAAAACIARRPLTAGTLIARYGDIRLLKMFLDRVRS